MVQSSPYITSLKPYVPGKPIEEVERELGIQDSVKLASNENPLGPSPKAIEALNNAALNINRYPDGSGFYLKKKLSQLLGVTEDQLILGNGSNELINLATYAYLTERDSAVMASPSFVVYPIATQTVGAQSIQLPLADYRHDLKKMASAITKGTKIVFIANPNNPTGTINTEEEFAEFMDAVPEGVLAIADEAYFEYVQDKRYPDTLKYLKQGRDILILRTFSKIYGLAGLRIGYGISQKSIINELDKVRPPFNANTPAQVAALHALDDHEHVQRSQRTNAEGKSFLYDQLKELGLDFSPSEANFIYLMLHKVSAHRLYEELLKKGVIIRPMGENAVRVTVGLPEENRKFIESLKEVL